MDDDRPVDSPLVSICQPTQSEIQQRCLQLCHEMGLLETIVDSAQEWRRLTLTI